MAAFTSILLIANFLISMLLIGFALSILGSLQGRLAKTWKIFIAALCIFSVGHLLLLLVLYPSGITGRVIGIGEDVPAIANTIIPFFVIQLVFSIILLLYLRSMTKTIDEVCRQISR